jgi:Esterase-like activity of phytase
VFNSIVSLLIAPDFALSRSDLHGLEIFAQDVTQPSREQFRMNFLIGECMKKSVFVTLAAVFGVLAVSLSACGGSDNPAPVVAPGPADITVSSLRLIGTRVREYTLPAMFNRAATETGSRGNAVFEGLAFTPDKSKAVVIMEGPLFQDGTSPSLVSRSVARITVFDRASGTASAQFAYPIDSVQATPSPSTAFTVNGPTEILALSNTKFLVLERSFSVGVVGNQVRLYEIDIAAATSDTDRNQFLVFEITP